jgi:hypothetical protein
MIDDDIVCYLGILFGANLSLSSHVGIMSSKDGK